MITRQGNASALSPHACPHVTDALQARVLAAMRLTDYDKSNPSVSCDAGKCGLSRQERTLKEPLDLRSSGTKLEACAAFLGLHSIWLHFRRLSKSDLFEFQTVDIPFLVH